MKVYSSYEKTIKVWSTLLSQWHSLVYCLTVCKRSAPLYYEFVDREDWGDKDTIALSHELLRGAIAGQPPSVERLEYCIECLDRYTPCTEDFPNGSYATDVGIIHSYSTDLLLGHKLENVYYVARYCYEIVDASIFEIIMPEGGAVTSKIEQEVEQHAFLQAEIGWQLRVREELGQLLDGDAHTAENKISEWVRTPLIR